MADQQQRCGVDGQHLNGRGSVGVLALALRSSSVAGSKPLTRTSPGRWARSAMSRRSSALSLVSSSIGADLTAISDAEDVDTLGGLIITLAGHVPARGEVVTDGGIEFEVVDADQRRVKRARIRKAGFRPPPILKENPSPPV